MATPLTCPQKTPPVIIEKLQQGKELQNEEGQAHGRADYRRADFDEFLRKVLKTSCARESTLAASRDLKQTALS
jgi:hypothetical protein